MISFGAALWDLGGTVQDSWLGLLASTSLSLATVTLSPAFHRINSVEESTGAKTQAAAARAQVCSPLSPAIHRKQVSFKELRERYSG